MLNMQQVLSYQIADSIDIKNFKNAFKAEVYYGDADELFYHTDTDKFIYVFKYGVVCFLNSDPIRISEFLAYISKFCKNRFEENLTEEYLIRTNAPENKIGYNQIEIVGSDTEVLRLIMLNVAQSVALDYYFEASNNCWKKQTFIHKSSPLRVRLELPEKI